jgi:hypothetical protein
MRTVTEIAGEPTRFYVSSARVGRPPYLVDLSENDGHGQCDCPDWRIRRAKKTGDEAQCKHLAAAFRFFGRKMARAITAQADRARR